MKVETNKFTDRLLSCLTGSAGFLTVVFVLALATGARAQDTFESPMVITGDHDTATYDNTLTVAESDSPTIAGFAPVRTVWFQWIAPANGEVTLDTYGSVDDTGITNLDTVLGVFVGTSLKTLNQVAVNDDLYPIQGSGDYIAGQNTYTFSSTNLLDLVLGTTAPPPAPPAGGLIQYTQPFGGPSGLRFNAVKDVTYYFVVDTKNRSGTIQLNWAYHSSGVFRFASEEQDFTGLFNSGFPSLTNSDGSSMLLYPVSATESAAPNGQGGPRPGYNIAGALVTITRVAGSTGKAQVSFTTADIDPTSSLRSLSNPGFLINGDLPAVAGIDYATTTRTVSFDDYEMSKTISIPIVNPYLNVGRPNRDFLVKITGASLDGSEDTGVSDPRVDNKFYQAVVRILDVNTDPRGVSTYQVVVTNAVPPLSTNLVVSTNFFYSALATNAVLNFQKRYFQTLRWSPNTTSTISIWVNRTGTNAAAVSCNFAVNSSYPYNKVTFPLANLDDNDFPLLAGSDYATPTPINPRELSTTSDYNFPGSYAGTLNWAANDTQPKPIQFTPFNPQTEQFDVDFQVDLYFLDSNGNPHPVGMVNQCNVTIGNAGDILAQPNAPAGAVNEFYNPDYASDFWTVSDPPNMAHPGTDGEVYGIATQPDGKAVLVGDFLTYNTYEANSIVRVLPNGYIDHSFNSGSGADDYISSVVLEPNGEILIAGNFSSYNGQSRNGVALVLTNGTLDASFNPGAGFNNLVSAIALQPDGHILVGGSFTSYRGTPRRYLARLNADGSLDSTFDAGTNLNAAVYTMALQPNGQILVGGDFTAAGGITGQDYIARFNSGGSLDTTFDPLSGANAPVYALAVQPDGNIVLGGDFTKVNGQSFNSIARLTSVGAIDPNFFCGIGVDGPVNSLVVDGSPIVSTDNPTNIVKSGTFSIYVGGAFTEYNGTHRLGFARLNNDGTLDTTFLDTAYNQFAGLTREYFADPVGVVNASAVLPNGNVVIGGSFDQIGGGDFEIKVRPNSGDSVINGISFGDPMLRIRSSIRNHSNFACLIGGATPGPGNLGLTYSTYSINESAGSMFVSLTRTNGSLGIASANFSMIPGLAQNGIDFIYDGLAPLYNEVWDAREMHSTALFGPNAVPNDIFNTAYSGVTQTAVNLAIFGSAASAANLNAQMQLANPSGADQFYLGGQNIPLGVGLGESLAPLTLINDFHASGTFGFASSNYVAPKAAATSIALLRTNGTYGSVTLSYSTITNGSTAVLNSDYRAASGSLTFDDSIVSRSFNVTVLNTNYISTVEKYVNLALTTLLPPSDGVAKFGLTNAVLRIINGSIPGFLNFSMTNYPASQSIGSVPVTVTRTVGSKGTLGVTIFSSNGTATSGTDYAATSTNFTWSSGDVSSRTIVVPLDNNNAFATSRYFYMNLTNATLNGTNYAALLLATNATVTVTNDLNAGTFEFSVTDYIVNENGGTATITVNRSGTRQQLLLPASVQYLTANATANAPANYGSLNSVLNFAPGQASASFTVGINNDGVVDLPPDQFYFTVNLASPGGGAVLGAPSTANVHIVDAGSFNRPPGDGDSTFNPGSGMDGPVYALAIQTNGLLLAGGDFATVNGRPFPFLARLQTDGLLDSAGFFNGMAGINGPVYSILNQTDNGIVIGGTFTDANGVFRGHIARLLSDGSVDSSFNPSAGADNAVYALAETFINGARGIYVGGAFNYMGRTLTPCLVRLFNNGQVDTGFNTGLGPNSTVFAIAAYPTNSPNAGKLLIGGSFSAVNNFPAPCIARLNSDGTVDTNFSLGLAMDGTVRSIVIQNDGGIVVGGDFLNAFDLAHGTNDVPASHLARIRENLSGASYLDTTNFAGFAGGPNGPVYALALQADNRIVVAGAFTQANGVTRNNITRLNADGSVDTTINFGDGANDAAYAALVQPGDQMIVLGGAFTQYDDLLANRIARIYPGGDITPGLFKFTASSYTVPENELFAPISIRRVGGTAGTNSVSFITTNITAFAGTNYVNESQSVVFLPGEVLKTINVPVMDDGVVTPDLQVGLVLTNASAPAGLGDQVAATLYILNVDSGFRLAGNAFTVPKNTSAGYFSIDVIRFGSTTTSNSVEFTTLPGGTAVPGVDYYDTNVIVPFDVGQTDQTVQIPILNNPAVTGNRTVDMELINALNAGIYDPSNAVLTIIDTVRAPGQFQFASANYSVLEGGGVGTTNVYLTVQRVNGSAGVAQVNFITQDGTAVAGLKYVSTNGTLQFNDGQTNQTFPVQIINTATAEGPQTFSVVLSAPTHGASLGSPTNAAVTIINTNTGVAFFTNVFAYTEPAGPLTLTLTLNVIRFNNTNGVVTVNYTTTNGTAVSGTDFIGVTNGTVTFNPGESVKPINISIMHNPLVTGDLTFTVGLFNPTAAALTPPTFIRLIDHDSDAGISFATNAASVPHNAGFISIPVLCSNPSIEPVSVNYRTGGGTAVPGADYTATSGTLTFAGGIASNSFIVPILINNGVLTNRTFNVTLSSPTPPGQLVPPSVETITIVGTNTPEGLSFATPIVINGLWGTTNADNTSSAPETGDPNIAGFAPSAPVWFQWTAPIGYDGEVTLDTIGSAGTNGLKLDTLLGVYTGTTLGSLNQVAVNDDAYPFTLADGQFNEMVQNIFNTNAVVTTNLFIINGVITPFTFTNSGEFLFGSAFYNQPFIGPSILRFNAKGGQTYFIAADTKSSFTGVTINGVLVVQNVGRGNIQLNWAYHPAGTFRFASEQVDQTGITGLGGNPMLLYESAETEGNSVVVPPNATTITRGGGSHGIIGPVTVGDFDTTFDAYYSYDVPGMLVTVTRVGGASGRVMVDYTTVDGNTNMLVQGDVPALAGQDYSPVSGTLIFDDFEMSKTILVPIIDDGGQSQPNRDFTVALSNPRRDPAESGIVSQPRVDPAFGQALCRILDCDIDPKGPSSFTQVFTNQFGFVNTNVIVSLIPTNGVFNFSKKNYRVPRDVQGYWKGSPVTIYVNRMGTNRQSTTIHYRFDNYFLTQGTIEDENAVFPLQPASDYAVPFAANPPKEGTIYGPTNFDFQGVGGQSGQLTFGGGNGANAFQSQEIHFNLFTNNITEFNKDILVTLYEDKNNILQPDGMVTECTVTILTDDDSPPAGAVDEFYNPDLGVDMANLHNPLGSAVLNPGTDPNSEVYSVVLTTNDQAIIGGSFATYADSTNTYTVNGLARLNLDGSLDTTFNSGGGVNVFPGGEFIHSVAISGSQVVIGGEFTSYNGVPQNNIARVNGDGSLDTNFITGAGANGEVWSVLVQLDGKVLIAGEFTTYNGAPANHVARLNGDGSLDATFNAGSLIAGPVYAMAFPPSKLLNFDHTANGGPQEDVAVLNLGSVTTGVLNVSYDMFGVPDDMRIFYGTTNTPAGTGVLLYDTTSVSGATNISVPFGPTNGITATNLIIVMNQGGSTNSGTAWTYNASVFAPPTSGVAVGGNFKVTGQSYVNIAELNGDGSLNTAFNPSTGPDASVRSLAWQLDNKIIAGGEFRNIAGISYNRLARFNPDGTIDPGFYVGTGADNTVYSITEDSLTGIIYIGGSFTAINGTHRLGFARLNPDATVDTTFLDTSYNQFAGLSRIYYGDAPGTVYASAEQGDGNVLIGGSFQEVGGGQGDWLVRAVLEEERGIQPSTADPNLWVSENRSELEPKTRDGIRNRSNIARLVGGATPGPGNVGMVSPSYAVNRSQAAESVTLVRANGSLGYASANFAVLPSLAQSGTDYSYNGNAPLYPIDWEYSGTSRQHIDGQFGNNGLMADPYNLLWKYGLSGPASVLINILSDPSVSGSLSAQFQMSNPNQMDEFYLGGQDIPVGVALGESQAPFSLVDNSHQDGIFGFAAPSFVATNSPQPVTIIRTNGTFGSVQLSFQTATNGSTAVVGTDYRATNGVVTFASGQSISSFPLTILNNSYISSVEKDVVVQLYNIQDLSGGTAQLGLTNSIVRIINPNFPGFLNFSTNAYYGTLSSGLLNFTVTRSVGSQGSLSVSYQTINGTAVSGVDFVGTTNVLTWNNNDVSPRTVSIPLMNHNVTGPTKQFRLNLFNAALNSSNSPALFGMPTNATCAIVNDNSYGLFQLSQPSYQASENAAYTTIDVVRTGSALGVATVNFATMDGTAFAGTNYVGTNVTLSFQPGQLLQSVNVRMLNDGVSNPPPASFYFGVGISSPSAGSALGAPTNSLVHIVDSSSYNQLAGSIDPSFDPLAGFNASVLALAQQSSGKIVAAGTFTLANGTYMNRVARFDTDGTLDPAFLNGLSGADGSVNAVVNQTDDRLVIGGQFAKVNGIGRQRIARLMTDGSLDSSFNSGAGADNTVFALAETFIGGNREIYVGGAFSTFNAVSSPGVARLYNNGLLDPSFAVGQGANGPVYAIAAYPTNAVGNAGKILVGGLFSNFNGVPVANLIRLNADGSLDTNFTANVTANNAVRAIAIQLDGGILIGGDFTNVDSTVANHLARLNGNGTLDNTFNNNAAPGVNGTVNSIVVQPDNRIMVGGQFSLANGVTRANITRLLANGGVDTTINFGTGANGAVNAIVIQAADENLVLGGSFTQYNGQERDYIVRIFGGSTPAGSGTFQFSSAGYQVDENAGIAGITIVRTGGTSGTNADGSGHVYVAFNTVDGSAKAGINYSYTTNYIDFPAGEVNRTIYVPVIDDGVITADLQAFLFLSNPSPGAALGNQSSSVLTIVNDDSTVAFFAPNYTVPKNTPTGLANILLVRQGSTSGSCTVNFTTTTNGSAVVGTDYYPTNILVTFVPGVPTNVVQVPVINNGLPEGPRTVSLALTNPVNTALSSLSNALLTIQDTVVAPGNLYFISTNFNANSSAGFAFITVGRTNGVSGSVSATFTTVSGTAVPGLNYITTVGTVTLSDGISSNTFAIPLINNPSPQGPVNFTVNLSNPTGGAGLIAPTNTTVTIFNTNAVFAFTQATNSTPEDAGAAILVVQRFNNTNISSTVNYGTIDGTAVAGINYSNTFGTLSFAVGEVFKSFNVPLIHNTNYTGDLQFNVALSGSVNAQLIAPSNEVVIVQDAEAGITFPTNSASVAKNGNFYLATVLCLNPRIEQLLAASNATPLTVSYYTLDGTAKAGLNYQAESGTLTFTNGNGTNTFVVPILDNQSVSGDTAFSIVLTNVTAPGRLSPYPTQTVTIAESNAGIHFSQADYTVFKNGVNAAITVIRSGFTNSTASVDYFVTNGTAINGQNFYATNGTLVFTNGVTSQAFNVQLIANSQVQPNSFAVMQLLNPTNSQIVTPGAARLTILENGGSYVIPAGTQLLTNSSALDLFYGAIGSNDTVQVLFAFRDSAGLNVTNLVAYLLATNGVSNPSPASQAYGPLTVYGHSVSRPFSFTAVGTNSYNISPTFQLYDNAKFIGLATFTITLGPWTTTFANTNQIVINDGAAASPYPSLLNVSGVGNVLLKATVTVTNLSDTSLGDLSALVVSPTTNTLIMAHVGGVGTIVNHVTLTFDDAASTSLPQNGVPATSTNKPTQFYPVVPFP